MVSEMHMFSSIFNLFDVRMCIAITCIVPRGHFKGSSIKKSVSGGSVTRGMSVKEELSNIQSIYKTKIKQDTWNKMNRK